MHSGQCWTATRAYGTSLSIWLVRRRFQDLRHSYATWLVDDEVPRNMVQRVLGHEHVSTTLQLYVRRTEHHDRIRKALSETVLTLEEPDDDGTSVVLVPIG